MTQLFTSQSSGFLEALQYLGFFVGDGMSCSIVTFKAGLFLQLAELKL
jgi:hypothetical protein